MLQHVPPSFTDHAAARIDAALVRVAQQLSYDDVLSDGITMRRFRLPARERGCGVRSRQRLVRHAAYAASFVRAAERFLDTTYAQYRVLSLGCKERGRQREEEAGERQGDRSSARGSAADGRWLQRVA